MILAVVHLLHITCGSPLPPFGWQIPHPDPLASLGAPASLSTVISACLPPLLPAQCHSPSRVAADGQVRRNLHSCATSAVGLGWLGWYHHLSRHPCLLLRIAAHWLVTWLMSKRKNPCACSYIHSHAPVSPFHDPDPCVRVCATLPLAMGLEVVSDEMDGFH